MHVNLIIFFTFFTIGSPFWVEVSPATSPKCFEATLFPHEDLLVETQIPIIVDQVQIQFIAKNDKQETIFRKLIQKSTDRITVSMDNSPKPGSLQVVQACIGSYVPNNAQKEELSQKLHLVWFAQLNHFSHEIETDKKQTIEDAFQIRFVRMKERIKRLQEMYTEQSSFFDAQQTAETKNQKKLEEAMEEAYTMILLESVAILGMTIAYIAVLKQYL